MLTETLNITGELRIVVTNELGDITKDVTVPNIITTAGKTFIAARLVTAGLPTAMSHMAVGTGSTAAAVGDTTLEAEVAASRTALGTSTPATNTVEYVTTFGAGVGTGALREAGIFNADPAGTLLCRSVFSLITKGAADAVTITWTVTIN